LALNSRGSVDPRWIFHNRSVALALHLANVSIYNEASSDQQYDPLTNTWTGSKAIKWEGKARIQPIGGATGGGDVYNPTMFQGVRVQLAYGRNELTGVTDTMPDFRMNDRMIVTSAPFNAELEKFIFTVTGVLNSSNPWEKTLLCVVDTELDPTEV
jgi:hypothetical protein